jgi:arylamine N-acetyltransferase
MPIPVWSDWSAAAGGAIRRPEVFWREHLEWGSGGTCFAATEAFRWLLSEVGLQARPIFADMPAERQRAHVALLVDTEKGPYLCDVGYALAAPVPLPKRGAVRRRTPHYDLEVRRGIAGEFLVFSEDDRGRRFRYRFEARPAAAADFEAAWLDTVRPEAFYRTRLALGRFGEQTRWLFRPPDSVTTITRRGEETIPLAEPRLATLARVFELPESLVREACAVLEP